VEKAFNETEKWERIAEMIIEDGGTRYSGPALRLKYKHLLEDGLESADPNVVAAARRGVVNGGVRGYAGGRAARDEDEGHVSVSSLDSMDRELMGELSEEEDGDDGDEDGDMGGVQETVEQDVKDEDSNGGEDDGGLSGMQETVEQEVKDEDDDDDKDGILDAELVGQE
jgi:hypothetical protein